ncbi:hypothetical protein GCM10007276_24250 [Agaricicola taiwanensis]|uniref:Tripartite tricarboxylate transporter substrate binding protein n=1 Tax=Agaricicola taiwanensis TaxID=591372 RepID=A0A8J2YJ58_9RHOB|nr:tripartite tricarboxylate transporter substrate binding protein [Agaricicola taiwanensis]GGE46198.1 hypothetical protein GCM10007276_24250 [Agaricicola taiwanensis]
MNLVKVIASAVGLSILSATPVLSYPDRPVKMIVAYTAGGATDLAARTMATFMEKQLGQPVVVINRPGAGGELGFTEVQSAAADGYTIGFVNMPPFLTMPIERKTKYSPDDFTYIANLVDDPVALAVNIESEFKSIEDIVKHAKENPGKLSYGTTGVGSDDHLAALAFEREAGIKLKHIAFSGGADVRQALIGGHIDLGVYNLGVMSREAADNLVRPLGMMGDSRWDGAPDVPTFKEAGYDVVQGAARGIAGPGGMPKEVTAKLAQAIQKTVDDPEFIDLAKKAPLPLRFLQIDDYNAYIRQEDEKYKKLWASQPWN